MRRTTIGFAVVGLLLSAGAAAQPRDTRKLQLEQFFDFETVSNPRISPDGTQIVYTRGWVDKVNDRRSSALWIMNADGGAQTQLTTSPVKEGSPVWLPDGSRIAFLRGSNNNFGGVDAEALDEVTRETSEIYVMNANRWRGRIR